MLSAPNSNTVTTISTTTNNDSNNSYVYKQYKLEDIFKKACIEYTALLSFLVAMAVGSFLLLLVT